MKWKNKIYPLNYVWFAKGPLIGEKNGNSTGRKLNIVQRNVLVKKYEN